MAPSPDHHHKGFPRNLAKLPDKLQPTFCSRSWTSLPTTIKDSRMPRLAIIRARRGEIPRYELDEDKELGYDADFMDTEDYVEDGQRHEKVDEREFALVQARLQREYQRRRK
jgi:hypothetical protein